MKEQIHVLYVDDELSLLQIGKIFLEQLGDFSVTIIPGAVDAIKLLKEQSFDVIISDYQMPQMDGIEFLKFLKKEGNPTPFILFTGKGREEVVIEALNNGADFYLQKGGEPTSQFTELSNKIRYTVSRRRAESELLESQKKIADIIDFLPDATFAINSKGEVIAWNRAIEEMTRISKDEIIGQGDYAYTVPFYGFKRKQLLDLLDCDEVEISSTYQSIQRKGNTLYAETFTPALYGGKGAHLWVTGAPLFDMKGNRVGAIESMRDISKRIEAEERIKRSEEKFAAAFAINPDPVAITDIQTGKIIDSNPAFSIWSGYGPEELIGKTTIELKLWVVKAEQDEVVASLFRHEDVLDKDVSLMIKNGEIRECTFSARFIIIGGTEYLFTQAHDVTSRHILERRIKDSEAHLTAAQKMAHLGSWTYTLDSGLIIWTDETFRIYGRNKSEGEPDFDELITLFHPDDQKDFTETVTETLKKGTPYEKDWRIILPDGNIRVIRVKGQVVERGDTIVGMWGTALDITERKLAEQALRESEERYRNVVEDQTEFISRFLPDGTHVFVNEAYCKYFGFKREEILGHHFKPKIPLEDRVRLMDFLLSLTPEHPDNIIEHRIIMPDGSIRWQRWSDRAIFDKSGSIVEYQSVGRDITEKKESEQALLESERKYRTLFETTGTATVLIENDGTISLANSEFVRLSGYPKEELENKKKWMEFVVREDLDRMLSQHRMRRENQQKALIHYEFRFRSRNGDIHYIFLTIDVIPGTLQSVASLLDISERRKIEEELIETNKEYAGLLNQIQTAYYRSDREGRLMRVSKSLIQMLGYDDVSECLGMDIAENFYVNSDDRNALLEEINLYGKVTDYEINLRKKNGESILISTNSHLHYDALRKIDGIEGTFEDITERKLAEQALRESEEKYRDIYENAVIGIFRISPEGRFISANTQAAKNLGYDSEDDLIQSITNINTQLFEDPETAEKVRNQLRSTGYLKDFEARFRRKNGEVIWGMLNIRSIRDKSGDFLYFEGISQDVTDRKRAEEALRQANRQLNLMTSITRHDINNKISSILAFICLVKDEVTDPELAEYCDRIQAATNMIKSQIEFTKVYQDLGAREPIWENLDLILNQMPIPDKITLHSDVQGLLVYADPMLERVFFNLLDNSIRHGEKVTEIRVHYSKQDDRIIIFWEDNGIGIPVDMKEQIFDRGVGKNTGLGLFLVREILMITGLSIRETGEPGLGAKFEIIVPNGKYRRK